MATITLTIPTAEVPRVLKVIGLQLGLKDANNAPRAATAAEVKSWLIAKVQDVVKSYELQDAQAQVSVTSIPIT